MSSEERDLPATERKLRKAREKGQVAQSKDFNSAVALIATIVYLAASLGSFILGFKSMWNIDLDFHDGERERTLNAIATHLGAVFISFVGPMYAVSIVAALVSDLIMKRGFVLSFDPISPKFDRLNPITGLANLVSLRKLIDLLKAFAKIGLLAAGEIAVLSSVVSTLVWLPTTGLESIPVVWASIMKSLSGVAVAIFALNGVIDMRLQSWLFLRDQRMSKTEKKNEQKDQRQNPEVMREVRRQGRAGANDPRLIIRGATIVIGDDETIVALRFVKSETPAPICILKEQGRHVAKLVREAEKRGIPCERDVAFIDAFYEGITKNNYPPKECFSQLAAIMKRYDLL